METDVSEKSNPILRTGMLQCFTTCDEETNLYISHCLNFDLMECGKTADEAWDNLKASLKQYIEYCYTNYQDGLTVSADMDDWKRYAEVMKVTKTPPRIEAIEIELRPPLPEYAYPIWMQGVNGYGVPSCGNIQ